MDLCVIVLTNNLDKEIKPPKYSPKVCYTLGDKSILEVCLDNIFRLNPKKIILMVSKHEIVRINKAIKHVSYSKLISYCIFDNQRVRYQRIGLAEKCYSKYNVLVVPGNSPMLTTKSMFHMITRRRSVKVNNEVFFLLNQDLERMDRIGTYFTGDENLIDQKELEQLETQKQYEDVLKWFNKKEESSIKNFFRSKSNNSV